VTLRLASLAHGKLVRLAALDDGTPLRVGALVRHAHRGAAVLVVAALALIYIPDIGHGFLRDDFMWIRVAQVETPSDLSRMFTGNVGFYRPAVTVSFAINRAVFGLRPLPYALTNFALLIVAVWLIARLGLVAGLAAPFALTAAAVWALNFHGINMALLWISGRTALLLCVFSVAAVLASIGDRRWWAALWSFLAMLSKEEAIVLPAMLVLWSWQSSGDGTLRGLARSIGKASPAVAALAGYMVLRIASGAFGPLNAPEYYRFTFAPAAVARNIAEYADRSCTVVVLVVLLAMAVGRKRPALAAREWRTVLVGAVWLVAGFALTVFLPLRSSLYALFPSIGSCLAGAVIMQALHRAAPQRVRVAFVVLVVLMFALVPVYRSRNDRWVAPADLSRRLVADLRAIGASVPAGTRFIAIDDERDEGISSAFGGLFADAVTLYVGRGCSGELFDRSSAPRQDGGRNSIVLRLRGGSLVADEGPG